MQSLKGQGVIIRIFSIFFLSFLLTFQLRSQTEEWLCVENGTDITSIILMDDTNIQFREKPEEAFKFVMPTFKAADLRKRL